MISFNSDKLNRYQRRMIELLRASKEIRFEEFKIILNSCGYSLVNTRGSHFKFIKPDNPSIMAIVHKNKVGRIYVKKAFKSLLFYL